MRNLVDARTLWELDAFPADVLAPDEFKRPSKDAVQAARDVRVYRRSGIGDETDACAVVLRPHGSSCSIES